MQIGLALGSGAARGLAHIGVLQGLVEAGIRPAAIAGTSIGALVGVLYARSLDPAQVREHVLRVIRGPVFRRICGEYWEAVRQARGSAGLWQRVGDLRRAVLRTVAVTRRSLVPPAKYAALIDAFVGENLPLETTRVSCVTVAAGLRTGQERIIGSGSMHRAVAASCAVPGVFPPVADGDDELVDGGILRPVPVTPARALGVDVVLAVDVGSEHLGEGRAPTGLDVILQSAAISRAALARLELARADLVIVPAVQHLDWFDFHRAEEAIERGVEAVRRVAQQLLALNGNGQARAAPSSGSNPSGRPLVIDGVLRRNPPGAPARGEAV